MCGEDRHLLFVDTKSPVFLKWHDDIMLSRDFVQNEDFRLVYKIGAVCLYAERDASPEWQAVPKIG